jgi:hypothetical protein
VRRSSFAAPVNSMKLVRTAIYARERYCGRAY